MSVVVAVKYKNGVVIGADKQATDWNTKQECTKLFQYKHSKVAIGCVGYLSEAQALEYLDEIIDYKDILEEKVIDRKYVYTNICNKLKGIYKDVNMLNINAYPNRIHSKLTLATNDKIFKIGVDFTCIECEKYSSNGCGEDLVKGYLDVQLNNVSPDDIDEDQARELVENSIRVACKDDVFIGEKIDIFNIRKEINGV